MKTRFYSLLLIAIVFLSCGHHSTPKKEESVGNTTLELTYAEGFKVQFLKNYKKVEVVNPWKKGDILAVYYLTQNDTTTTPNDGQKIVVPITHLASSSVTHLEFLQLLGEIESIKGFCNPKLAFNQKMREKNDEIVDLGDGFNINIEKTVALHPQAIMLTAYNQTNPNTERLQKTGIPIIYNNEWLESHLLGRAEWIKFVSLFFNKEEQADSIFNATVKKYNELKTIAQKSKSRPSVLSGNNFRGTWYIPGGKSYMGQLFRDANADYFYTNDTTKGSLPLSIEAVLKNFSKADFWLNSNFNTYEELLGADDKHQLFTAVQKDRVYNFNKRSLPNGANDYWEGAVAHPDKLLADFIAILHPELLTDWELFYAKKLTQKNNESDQ